MIQNKTDKSNKKNVKKTSLYKQGQKFAATVSSVIFFHA
jgi:hypothetical protein